MFDWKTFAVFSFYFILFLLAPTLELFSSQD